MGRFDVSSLEREVGLVINHCLVIGASGFMGRALCDYLSKKNIQVRAMLRQQQHGPWLDSVVFNLNSFNNNIHKSNFPESAFNGIDAIFYVAGIAHASKNSKIPDELYYSTNLNAAEQVLQLASQSNIKYFIYFSSVKAIGKPQDPYGKSKQMAEERVLKLGQQLGIHVCILRPSLVYGPHVKGNLFNMIRAIDKGWFPPLPETHNQRSMISVYDIVEVALMSALNPIANGKIYTVTDGKPYSTRQLYDAIRKALGLSPCQWFIPKGLLQIPAYFSTLYAEILEKLLRSEFYASELIQNELGWIPKRDFYSDLPEMISVYRQNQSR